MLITEDGTIVENAESYNSSASAGSVLARYYSSAELAAWNGLAESARELFIRRASEYLDGAYRSSFLGEKTHYRQHKEFPRMGIRSVSSNEIPVELLRVEASIALAMASGQDPLSASTLTSGDTAVDPGVTSESVTIGPISISSSYAGPKSSSSTSINAMSTARFPAMSALLGRLTGSGRGKLTRV